ncbi:hypothetical protein FIBSPDRAFT_123695 [Athelia psychrophila]|uniref:Uncharacterized protein n=1 Tax=Athelia psychrophila TaxID=1759441 RepID=A0A166CIZ2_9AGAM|nr:hypothetical protein FIBSPDRAFT_251037 [Fibularhizoctonia sp. CBS 109695]KZP13702.1 hypothetical protein FIBSPDRAFT_123695 [Fibularhizoctonia sp. CBS 109695]
MRRTQIAHVVVVCPRQRSCIHAQATQNPDASPGGFFYGVPSQCTCAYRSCDESVSSTPSGDFRSLAVTPTSDFPICNMHTCVQADK